MIVPATAERWPDVALLLDGDGEEGCWCQSWRGKDLIARTTGESRPVTLRRQMDAGPPPPGYLAYVGGEPAGWVGVGVRTATPRLMASRTIPSIDERSVSMWALTISRRAG